ncbi:MAG: hypothetical protein DRI61_10135 [Chloroflexi bacterium]|nr:MAG: hypothetical protein DRI61_10135 [Chloroflexota bacterium]
MSFEDEIHDEILSTVAVDFDGVIHKNSKGFHDGTIYDEPVDGAVDAIKFLSKSYRVVIFTCKANPSRPLINGKTGHELIVEWLTKYGIINFVSSITHEKPGAFLYIDDKAIRFTDWNDMINYIDTNSVESLDISKF